MAIGTNPGGGTLAGTTAIAATAGVATFPGLSINRSGTGYTLTATATGLTGATSTGFNITPGAASVLVFTTQPGNTTAGVAMTPAVVVTARDNQGNTATAFTGTVTVAIGTNPAAGTLAGTTAIAATAGVATFSTLSINAAGNGYTLTAAATGLTGAISATFNIVPGAASLLVFTQQPTLPLAETSSVFCEMLITDRLRREATSRDLRRELLALFLDSTYAAILRQASLVQFELVAHDAVRRGASVEELGELYMANLRRQFGDAWPLLLKIKHTIDPNGIMNPGKTGFGF